MDDDDEFGGFEAAEPAGEAENDDNGVQAGPSPWAFFPGAGGANQPDLIQPPGGPAGNAADIVRPNVQDPLEPNFNAAPRGRGPEEQGAVAWQGGGMRSFSEQVLEPHFGSNRPGDQPVPDGVLDLDLTNRQASARPVVDRQLDDLDLQLEPDLGDLGAAAAEPSAEREAHADAAEPQIAWPKAAADEGGEGERRWDDVDALQQQLSASQQAKSRLQQELEEMIRKSGRLEEELGRLEQELTEQRQRYTDLQATHARDLEDMRQAGHQALAVIVDEYKELCKTAVLEQQQACQTQVIEVIQQEHDNYTKLLNKQAEYLEAKLESERASLHDYVKTVIAEQSEKAQKELNERIQAGKTDLEEHITSSLQREKEENEALIKAEVEKEGEKLKSTFAEEQSRLSELYEEEKVKLKEEMAEALVAENERCKECMKEAVRAERERGQQLSRDVIAQAHRHVQSYLDDHKQRDAAVRKKSLASVELLLSSAQTQLQALLGAEPTLETVPEPALAASGYGPSGLERRLDLNTSPNVENNFAPMETANSDFNHVVTVNSGPKRGKAESATTSNETLSNSEPS